MTLNGLLNPVLTKQASPNMWDRFYSGYNNFLGSKGMKNLTQGFEHSGYDSGWQTAGKMLVNGINTINPMRYVGRAAQDANVGNWKGYAGNAGSALFAAGTLGGGTTAQLGKGLLSKGLPSLSKGLPNLSKAIPTNLSKAIPANRFATQAELGSMGGMLGGFLPGKSVPGQPHLRHVNPNDLMA